MIDIQKVVVYTSIIGGIDKLKEDQVTDSLAFHAFVDRDVPSDTWITNKVSGHLKDPRRTARMYKTLAHQLFPNAEFSVWIDGTISVTSSLIPLIEEFARSGKDLATFRHPERDCLYAEPKPANTCAWTTSPASMDKSPRTVTANSRSTTGCMNPASSYANTMPGLVHSTMPGGAKSVHIHGETS